MSLDSKLISLDTSNKVGTKIKMSPHTLIYTLPDEILVYVASFLVHDERTRCAFARVCRRFCGVAHDTFDQAPAFQHACRCGYITIVQRFLTDERLDPTMYNNAIQISSYNGHADVVQLLLADGRADPTAGNSWAILWSSFEGHADVVKLLLADGRADPTADDNYAICVSSNNGHADVVQLLLADGRADPTVY